MPGGRTSPRRRSLTISITTKRVVGHRIKIFEVDICPSSKELQHLEKLTGGQPEKMKAALKDYVSNEVMEEYAKAAGKRGRVEDPANFPAKT
ncbi:DUF5712 family protein [Mucilaginibacter antarcticus]|uniref:DUF5712 family protein n=1 Tax=Mucilaginibacter antarcticus TaxID=1855725 RepID=UPI003630B85B